MGRRPKEASDRFWLCPACGRYARVFIASSQVHARCQCTLFVSAVGDGPAQECIYAQTIGVPLGRVGVETKVVTREELVALGIDPEPRPEPRAEVPAGAADRGGAGRPSGRLAGAGWKRGPSFREEGAGAEPEKPPLRGHDPEAQGILYP